MHIDNTDLTEKKDFIILVKSSLSPRVCPQRISISFTSFYVHLKRNWISQLDLLPASVARIYTRIRNESLYSNEMMGGEAKSANQVFRRLVRDSSVSGKHIVRGRY